MADQTQIPNSKSQVPNNNQGSNTNNQKVVDPGADLAQITKDPTESMAEIVEDFEAGQEDYQAMYDAGGVFKKGIDEIAQGFEAIARQSAAAGTKGGVEREPSFTKASEGKLPEEMTEILTEPEVEKKPELEGYLEKVEKAGETQQVIVDDYTQAILLKPTQNQNVKVKLPLTEDQIQQGLHHKVWESVRWLAEWCLRQVKILKDRVVYKS